MNESRAVSIRSRLWMLVVLAVLGMFAVAAIALYKERGMLMEDRMNKTRNVVEVAQGVVAHFHAQQQQGMLDEYSARAAAASALKGLRYDGIEYFWVNDLGAPYPRMVMHPTVPALDGQVLNASRYNSATGARGKSDAVFKAYESPENIFVAFAQVARNNGSGFVTYLWPKPRKEGGVTEQQFEKLSFVSHFEPWGWVIGSGIYIDDVDELFVQQALSLLLALSLIGAVIGVLILVTIRRITRPLDELCEAMHEIESSKNLGLRVDVRSADEIGRIGEAFNAMVGSFEEVLRHLTRGVHEARASAGTLSGLAEKVADSSALQSDATASMAAAVEQLSVSIDHVDTSASEAHDVVQETAERSTRSGAVIDQAIQEMQQIAESVKKTAVTIRSLESDTHEVSGIAEVIREIAEQTNLLALNAAIEAARAGEQGRGFAVVADEVRKLAERTSQATVQIAGMLQLVRDSARAAANDMDAGVNQVENGAQLAESARIEVSAMRASNLRITDAVESISLALREQSAATKDIADRVEKVSQGTENASAGATGVREAAIDLSGLAERLEALVGRFRVGI